MRAAREGTLAFATLVAFVVTQGPLETHAATLNALDPTDFFSVAPCRVIDTRSPDGPLGGPALVAGADRAFPLSGVCGMPADATAVSVNIAVTGATAAGNLRLHAGGTAVPLVSTINYSAGQTRSNNAVVALSPTGELAAFVGGAPGGSVHFILDVNGYFAAPAAGLVINEVDYDQPGTDATEYVEIHNPTAAAIPLANLALILVNGAGTPAEYRRVLLGPAGAIAAGGYLVIATAAVTVQGSGVRYTPPIADWPTTDAVQNGSPDGMLLVDTATFTVIDRLSYEGSVTVNLTGFGSVNLVEGTAVTAIDDGAAAPATSIARIPNGTDTNNAASDWAVTTTLTPGAANVP